MIEKLIDNYLKENTGIYSQLKMNMGRNSA